MKVYVKNLINTSNIKEIQKKYVYEFINELK